MSELQTRDFVSELHQGKNLSAAMAAELDNTCSLNVDAVSTHVKLIGFNLARTPETLRSRFTHIFWLIEHDPGNNCWPEIVLLSTNELCPSDLMDEARERWLKQVDLHPNDALTAAHAGLFLIERDPSAGEMLLNKAICLFPSNEDWPRQLASYQFLETQRAKGPINLELAKKSLASGARFLKMYGKDGGRKQSPLREMALGWCAQSALWSEEFILAREYAEEHLELIKDWTVLPKVSHSVLGLLALRSGDIVSAKRHLLILKKQSLLTKLDLQLANELLAQGETSTVLRYLDRCQALGHWLPMIAQWKDEVTMGHKIGT